MSESTVVQTPKPRPLSPHLQIYRWQNSMTLSILHRATGIALAVGLLLMAAWLWGAAYAPELHYLVLQFITSRIGALFLIGWSFAFYYHLGNGIRHLFWDMGKGYTLPVMARSGWAVIIWSLLATGGTWGYVFGNIW